MDNFIETEKQISLQDFIDIEELAGFKELPEDFKQHYLLFNGGFPPYDYVKGDEYILSLNGFFSVKYGNSSIEKTIESYRDQNINFGSRMPFAYDSGGNLFFIQLDVINYGHVELGQHEFFAEPDEDTFIHVCDSFSLFLEGMTNDEE